jgi:hypothetical protein
MGTSTGIRVIGREAARSSGSGAGIANVVCVATIESNVRRKRNFRVQLGKPSQGSPMRGANR